LVEPADDDESLYYVFDGRKDAPEVRSLAIGSAGLDGCALTTSGAIHCYGANEDIAKPGVGPFTAAALRRNGLALCALREDRTLTCAAGGGAFADSVAALPSTPFASLGGFFGSAVYVVDDAGAVQGFGSPGAVTTLVSPAPLAQLSCEDAGCAGLGQDGSLVCFSSTGQAQSYAVDAFTEVIRLPTGCCGLRERGDAVCINAPDLPLQPREFSQARLAKIRYVPGLGVCGPTVSGAGVCVDMY
jgi:hypothetical protein